ncbi:hypothetical protein F4820DRAFT_447000 [Hypoxylon rubiginosum]|uniref:Uncharacterized protein n=1 Tax=Hypoxylon rubiginosum TaxID=110542 RepID=A0ACB9Z641_9PEZI|nr:hypothetical protein F4820DRAFT_447000 [Hypoxylon rubiginosum]
MPTDTRAATATAKVNRRGRTEAASPSFESYLIKNTNINEAPGVELSLRQKLIVGSVLDTLGNREQLFEGHPTLKHLSLWSRDATFADPLTIATGYHQFAAQWYGLPAVFNPIRIQDHSVTSAGNPIELQLTNTYGLKGLNKEQTINSTVRIYIGRDQRIERVEDRWNARQAFRCLSYHFAPYGSWCDHQSAGAGGRIAFRKLNAVTVPRLITVPGNEEEDMRLKADREKSTGS